METENAKKSIMLTIMKLIIVVLGLLTILAIGYWLGLTQSHFFSEIISASSSNSEQKILYYRNPMGLPDKSPVPKKDPMGMDYLPVYKNDEPIVDQNIVAISTEKVQKLGVRTEAATMRELIRTVHAVATIQLDERTQYSAVTKFEGWVQRLHVNTTGQTVKKGDPLMDIYSPELIAAQQEYLIATRGLEALAASDLATHAAMQRLVDSALLKLRNWDIAETELKQLQRTREVQQYLTLRSQADGVVLKKNVILGQRIIPGEVLYQIANLSKVWLLADIFEQDLDLVRPGQSVTIRVDAYPGKVFSGEVAFIYPVVTPETRTAIVRIVLTNLDRLLKPAMYARVEFTSFHGKDKVLTVPNSAILDSGTRRVVLVDLGTGRYEPRAVKIGIHANGYSEVLGGLRAGEQVVVKANFLIDAESNFKNALNSFGHTIYYPVTDEQEITSRTTTLSTAEMQHQGEGSIEAIDFAHATITLAHGPISSLKWPAMTMDFRVAEPALLQTFKPGQQVTFEIAEETSGEFVIVHIQPANTFHDH